MKIISVSKMSNVKRSKELIKKSFCFYRSTKNPSKGKFDICYGRLGAIKFGRKSGPWKF